MVDNLIIAGVAFIGTIIGALGGGVIPHFLQEKSNNKIYRRQRLEEIYININNWINTSFHLFIINFYLVFEKAIDWNEYLDKIIENSSTPENSIYKSEIAINLYFRELLSDYEKLKLANQDITKFINTEIKSCYLVGSDIQMYKSAYDAKVKNIISLSDKLKYHIQEMAKKF